MDNRDTCAFFVLFFLFLLVLPFGQLWWYKMIHHTRRKRIEICAARTNSQIMHTRCKRIKTCAERKKGGGTSQPTNQHRDLLQQLLLLQRRPVPPAASAIIATAPAAMTEENERVKERKRERIPGSFPPLVPLLLTIVTSTY